jgi:hypothetical protein
MRAFSPTAGPHAIAWRFCTSVREFAVGREEIKMVVFGEAQAGDFVQL